MKDSFLLLEFALFLLCAGCGGTSGTGPKEIVRQHALEVARGASLTFEMDIAVENLSVSVDGTTALIPGGCNGH